MADDDLYASVDSSSGAMLLVSWLSQGKIETNYVYG